LGSGILANSPVVISNLANGIADNDAVNVSQLRDAVSQANAYTDQQFSQLANRLDARIDNVRFDLTEYRMEAQAGIASVSALTQLRYHDDPGAISIGGAIGGFMGQVSIASGIGYTSENQRINLNAGFGFNPARNEATWGAGATIRID
ncbi:MAG: YadA-like family protein, partial [Pseudomonadota bacterium]